MGSMFERLKEFAKREFGYDIKVSEKKEMTFTYLFATDMEILKEQNTQPYGYLEVEYSADSRETNATEDHNAYDFSDDLLIAA